MPEFPFGALRTPVPCARSSTNFEREFKLLAQKKECGVKERPTIWLLFGCYSQLFSGGEYGFHMSGHLYFSPDATDDAISIDQERGPVHAHIGAAV